jgi:hypothetical protein
MSEYQNNGSQDVLNVSVGLMSGQKGPHQERITSQEEEVAEKEADFGLILVAAGVSLRSSSSRLISLNLKKSLRKPTQY